MIRKATEKDVEAVYKFFSLPELDRYQLVTMKSLDEFRLYYNKRIGKTDFYLYEEKGEAIGILGYYRFVGRQDHGARIGPVLVFPDHRAKGIGSKLMEQLFKDAKEQGVFRLEVLAHIDDEKAINFYKKHGFEIEGTFKEFFKLDGKYLDVYMIVKFLEHDN